MEQLSKEAQKEPMSRTSHVKPSKPHKSGDLPVALLAKGNALLLAIIRDLTIGLYGVFPLELVNLQVNGEWVAHLRLKGQMWNQDGGLQSSRKIASSDFVTTGNSATGTTENGEKNA